jgi:glutamyl-tRNA reductase
MITPFKSVSISHRSAPLTIREMVALNEDESKAFTLKCKDLFGLQELLIVSTCNRTELYFTTQEDISEQLIKALLIEKGLTNTADYVNYFIQRNETNESLQHLF